MRKNKKFKNNVLDNKKFQSDKLSKKMSKKKKKKKSKRGGKK